MCANAQSPSAHNNTTGKAWQTQTNRPAFMLNKQPQKVTAYDLLGCPDSTVLGGEYTEDAAYTGFQTADQGRPGMSTTFFQHFSGNYNTINGVRFLGLFNYFDEESYNWLYCNDRAGIDDDGNSTKPVRFEIAFYKEGDDGMPGELVYSKEENLLGEGTGVQIGDSTSGFQTIQAFNVKLDEDVKLESGFLSVAAVDMGDNPTCWFSVFTASSSMDYGLLETDGEYQYAMNPMIFCLKGNGDFAAKKALKISRLLTPTTSSDGKYERVEVELENMGSETISDATLQLYADGKLLSTEKVNAAIPSLGTYKFTFRKRIDCSEIGEHKFEVRNVTPGDEQLCAQSYSFSTTRQAPGETGASASTTCNYNYIKTVRLGSKENITGATNYSDFTNITADIVPGDTLALEVVPTSMYAYLSGWIDWNGNGILGENGETITFDPRQSYEDTLRTAKIVIPSDIDLEEGSKLMRLITSYDTPSPTGTYSYGETEDYTINVKRPDNSPAISNDKAVIDTTLAENPTSVELVLGNHGESTLEGTLQYEYTLPGYPSADARPVETKNAPFSVNAAPLAPTLRKAAPSSDDDTEFTLKYDGGQYDIIGISNSDTATYAQLYPGDMLSSISGMTLNSVDVYVGQVASKSSIVVYGQNYQSSNGSLITEQEFTAQPMAWNHVILDKPVTVGNTDLWVGLKVSGLPKDGYCIGIDRGAALRGFGDIVNIGGDTWWSMGDLGVDANYCIRANVTGARTPAISWLNLDDTDINVNTNSSHTYKVTLGCDGLADNSLYEAQLVARTNDALRSVVRIPVYLTKGTLDGISTNKVVTESSLMVNGNNISVNGMKEIAKLTLYSLAGNIVASGNGNSVVAPSKGLYLLHVAYADGSANSMKVLVK